MHDSQTPAAPREAYRHHLEARNDRLAACAGRHGTAGNLRLLVAIGAGILAYLAWGLEALSVWWLLVPLVLFVWLGVDLQSLLNEKTKLARAIAFYERALARLDGRWAGTGESGERFLDDHHLYARDLDLLGDSSLFQLLSSARTRIGEETLAGWLLAPAPPETISERQQAIVELAPKLELREDLAVLSEDARTGLHPQALAAWGEGAAILQPSPFRALAWLLSVMGALAVVGLLACLVAAFALIELPPLTVAAAEAYFLVVALILGAVLWRFRQRTERILGGVEEAAHDLGLLAGVLRRLEAEQFSSPRLAALRSELDSEGQPPSRRIARLNRLMDLVDSRHNLFMRVLGPLVLWDVHLAYAIEDWRRVSGTALRRWLNAVGEMEALSSLAGFRYEQPSYVFPEIAAESPCFDGEGLAHPLLGGDNVVANDLRLGGDLRLLVVSGSNMSGKSTLLRTAGVNAVLAQAGAPVRARRLRLSPLAIGASIQVHDSLQEGTSRFYAEIKRLRQIMEQTEAKLPVLFLIDEFLHGTNSHDRRIGAEAIVRSLVERGAIGLVTTHDLALAHIADVLAPRGQNVHFEDHLEDGRMLFDYRMRPGIVEKSNALELMRSVGLEV